MTPIRIGLDIAKNVFQVHGVDDKDTVVIRKRLRRPDILRFFASLPPCLVGLRLFGIASLGQRTDPAWARGTAHAGPLRQAVCATRAWTLSRPGTMGRWRMIAQWSGSVALYELATDR